MMNKPAISVRQIHFEDLDGADFERLTFAYHWRTDDWHSLEWYGQTGSDLGRDIWGVRKDGTQDGESVCIQCANRKNLTFAKIEKDIAKVLKAPNGVPHRFRIVAQSKISAEMRDKIKLRVKSLGVRKCDIWSGPEFEEFLRGKAESLLKRYFDGETFPDIPEDLKALAASIQPVSDDEILALYARVFDRPAFYTPIHQESDMSDFKQAITDTIRALGSGIWKTRDGDLIDRIPPRHQLKSESLRAQIQLVEKALSRLRAKYDEMTKSGMLRRCLCGNPNCPTFYFDPPHATQELENLREDVLIKFRKAYPALKLPSW